MTNSSPVIQNPTVVANSKGGGLKSTGDQFSAYLRRVLLVANRKGGVLKSSIVRSVADEAGRLGYRVLVIDGDPQGNLSKIDFGLGLVEVGGWDSDRGRGLAMALQYGTDLTPISAHGVDVVCGGPELLGALGAANNVDLDMAANLRGSLARLCSQNRYDLVLIDSGPGDTKLLDAYMLTAKWLVVPVVDGDEASFDGLDKMGARTVDLTRNRGAEIELLGAVLTLVDHQATVRNKAVLEDLAAAVEGAGEPFTAMIRDSKAARSDTRRYGLSASQVAEKAEEVRRTRFKVLRERAAEMAPDVSDRRRELVAEFRAANNRGPSPEERKEIAKRAKSEVREARKQIKPGRHKASADDRLADPDELWATRDGSGLAGDYTDLTKQILGRIGEKLGANVA